MGRDTAGKIAAVAAVAVLMALAVAWGVIMRPSEPRAVACPAPADTAATDSIIPKKERRTRRNSTQPKKKHVPVQRDFLNEPVPSE